jgi:hypothetical protein
LLLDGLVFPALPLLQTEIHARGRFLQDDPKNQFAFHMSGKLYHTATARRSSSVVPPAPSAPVIPEQTASTRRVVRRCRLSFVS